MTGSIHEEVRAALQGPCGVPRGAGLLVACSGGRDSVVLLDLLAGVASDLELELCAATVDHGLRDDVDDELTAAERACRAVDVPWCALRVELDADLIRRRGVEAAARAARRAELLRQADREGAEFVALGHHRRDQAETVLMRALVGTGLRGLAAMRPRTGRWVRPLLGIDPGALAEHAEAAALRWAEDPSNGSPRFLRNRIRHRLLPRVEEIVGPSGVEQLARLADRCADDEALLHQMARHELEAAAREDGATDAASLAVLPVPLQVRAVAALVREKDPDASPGAAHLAAALDLVAGPHRRAGLDLPDGLRLEREGAALRAVKREPEPDHPEGPVELILDGITPWPAAGVRVRARIHADRDGVGSPPDAGTHRAWFDLDRLTMPVRVNTFSAGTRMQPFGGAGSRKVSDVLGEAGIPRRLRTVWPVVYDAREILWVPGARAADVARVNEGTRRILELSLDTNR